MKTSIEFGKYTLAVMAEGSTLISGGYLLTGREVTLLHPFGASRFYRHGFHSWSLSSWLHLETSLEPPVREEIWPQIDHPYLLERYPFRSSGVSAVEEDGVEYEDGQVLLLGALGLDAVVEASAESLHGMCAGAEGEWFAAYGPEKAVFAAYAGLLGERLGRRGQNQAPRVWCSWYSFYTGISAPQIENALSVVSGLPFEVFQVDDGWQVNMGDWEANEKFPAGMAALAGKIRSAGFTPGLWLAPLIVQPSSALLTEHPGWLLRHPDGSLVKAGHNWGDDFFSLDATHPEAQAWLAGLIARVCGWGFSYLKLDFLYAAALPGTRYQDLPGEAAFRRALETVRRAAGEETYILACGAPVLASIGLADGIRIGPDVAPIWDNEERSLHLRDLSGPGTLNALRTSLARLWLRPLLHTDPDVVYFRTRYNLLHPHEKRLLQDLALIAEFRATSDLSYWLDTDELVDLIKFLQASPEVEQVDRYLFRVDGREVDFSFLGGL